MYGQWYGLKSATTTGGNLPDNGEFGPTFTLAATASTITATPGFFQPQDPMLNGQAGTLKFRIRVQGTNTWTESAGETKAEIPSGGSYYIQFAPATFSGLLNNTTYEVEALFFDTEQGGQQ